MPNNISFIFTYGAKTNNGINYIIFNLEKCRDFSRCTLPGTGFNFNVNFFI